MLYLLLFEAVISFIYCSSLRKFSEATDKLKELEKKASILSTVRMKLYNTESGTKSKESPTLAKKNVQKRTLKEKQTEEEGLTVIMSHSKLRELLESFRDHIGPYWNRR